MSKLQRKVFIILTLPGILLILCLASISRDNKESILHRRQRKNIDLAITVERTEIYPKTPGSNNPAPTMSPDTFSSQSSNQPQLELFNCLQKSYTELENFTDALQRDSRVSFGGDSSCNSSNPSVPSRVTHGFDFFSVITFLGSIDPRTPKLVRQFKERVRRRPSFCRSLYKLQYIKDLDELENNLVVVLGSTVQLAWPDVHQPCMITQLTSNRLQNLWRITEAWQQPLVAAVQVNSSHLYDAYSQVLDVFLTKAMKRVLVIFSVDHQKLYPVNWLRNVALKHAFTDYILLNDIDFVPSEGLGTYLQKWTLNGFLDFPKTAMVVPAFERLNDTDPYPRTKAELLKYVQRGLVIQFHDRGDYTAAHALTNYTRWYNSSHYSTYPIDQPKKCFCPYEPYVIVKKSNALYFSEIFLQRFFNKQIWFAEMCMNRYQLYVFTDGFLLHLPHASGSRKAASTCPSSSWRVMQKYYSASYNNTGNVHRKYPKFS